MIRQDISRVLATQKGSLIVCSVANIKSHGRRRIVGWVAGATAVTVVNDDHGR